MVELSSLPTGLFMALWRCHILLFFSQLCIKRCRRPLPREKRVLNHERHRLIPLTDWSESAAFDEPFPCFNLRRKSSWKSQWRSSFGIPSCALLIEPLELRVVLRFFQIGRWYSIWSQLFRSGIVSSLFLYNIPTRHTPTIVHSEPFPRFRKPHNCCGADPTNTTLNAL